MSRLTFTASLFNVSSMASRSLAEYRSLSARWSSSLRMTVVGAYTAGASLFRPIVRKHRERMRKQLSNTCATIAEKVSDWISQKKRKKEKSEQLWELETNAAFAASHPQTRDLQAAAPVEEFRHREVSPPGSGDKLYDRSLTGPIGLESERVCPIPLDRGCYLEVEAMECPSWLVCESFPLCVGWI